MSNLSTINQVLAHIVRVPHELLASMVEEELIIALQLAMAGTLVVVALLTKVAAMLRADGKSLAGISLWRLDRDAEYESLPDEVQERLRSFSKDDIAYLAPLLLGGDRVCSKNR
eukprot:scaffold5774_cov105-Pinguiococcus_pyrenoidosus.AAC.1